MRASNPILWKKASPQSTHTTTCAWLRRLTSMESLPSMAGPSCHWEPRSSWLHRIAIQQSICTIPIYAFVTGGSKLYGPYQHVAQVVETLYAGVRQTLESFCHTNGALMACRRDLLAEDSWQMGLSTGRKIGLERWWNSCSGQSAMRPHRRLISISDRLSSSRGCGGAGSRGARCRSHIRSP